METKEIKINGKERRKNIFDLKIQPKQDLEGRPKSKKKKFINSLEKIHKSFLKPKLYSSTNFKKGELLLKGRENFYKIQEFNRRWKEKRTKENLTVKRKSLNEKNISLVMKDRLEKYVKLKNEENDNIRKKINRKKRKQKNLERSISSKPEPRPLGLNSAQNLSALNSKRANEENGIKEFLRFEFEGKNKGKLKNHLFNINSRRNIEKVEKKIFQKTRNFSMNLTNGFENFKGRNSSNFYTRFSSKTNIFRTMQEGNFKEKKEKVSKLEIDIDQYEFEDKYLLSSRRKDSNFSGLKKLPGENKVKNKDDLIVKKTTSKIKPNCKRKKKLKKKTRKNFLSFRLEKNKKRKESKKNRKKLEKKKYKRSSMKNRITPLTFKNPIRYVSENTSPRLSNINFVPKKNLMMKTERQKITKKSKSRALTTRRKKPKFFFPLTNKVKKYCRAGNRVNGSERSDKSQEDGLRGRKEFSSKKFFRLKDKDDLNDNRTKDKLFNRRRGLKGVYGRINKKDKNA